MKNYFNRIGRKLLALIERFSAVNKKGFYTGRHTCCDVDLEEMLKGKKAEENPDKKL